MEFSLFNQDTVPLDPHLRNPKYHPTKARPHKPTEVPSTQIRIPRNLPSRPAAAPAQPPRVPLPPSQIRQRSHQREEAASAQEVSQRTSSKQEASERSSSKQRVVPKTRMTALMGMVWVWAIRKRIINLRARKLTGMRSRGRAVRRREGGGGGRRGTVRMPRRCWRGRRSSLAYVQCLKRGLIA